MIVAVITSNDLLVAYALACPFLVIAFLLSGDIARWFRGGSSVSIGVGEDARLGSYAGTTATTRAAAGADYRNLDTLIDEITA